VLQSTHDSALAYVSLDVLRQHAWAPPSSSQRTG